MSCWLALATGCAAPWSQHPPGTAEPLFDGLGDHHFAITTDSHLAQRYFDQGRMMRYGFAFEASRRAFDPACAMAWWGVAWSRGPDFWSPVVSPEDGERAWQAIERARFASDNATPRERALVEAVAKWHSRAPDHERPALNQAYAEAMAQLWREYPADAEIGTLYAQALIALRPRGLWTYDAHRHPVTKQLVAVLEQVLALDADHPGANHFLIHAVEASPDFRSGQAAADRLRTLAPRSPHLLHMPSHIDIRTGNWDQAIEQSHRANAATRSFLDATTDGLVYSPAWTHNYHLLAFACMMGGRYEEGLAAGRALETAVLKDRTATRVFDRWRLPILYEVHIRFGRWQEMLHEPAPPEEMPFVRIMWHFARAVARAALGQVDDAEREHARFVALTAAFQPSARIHRDLTPQILAVADLVVRGEIAFQRGDTAAAVRLLQQATEREDRLKYYEPPLWHQPARHALGAVLVKVGRLEEAEQVYREDLRRWPNNGWSLHGLETCLRARGATDEAAHVRSVFERAWANADTSIAASCLCVLER